MPQELDYAKPPRRPRQALYWVGFPLMVFGSGFSGASIANQLKNTTPGVHYYNWLGLGVLCFVIGFALMLTGRKAR